MNKIKLFRVDSTYQDGECEYTETYFYKCTIEKLELSMRMDLSDFSVMPLENITWDFTTQKATTEEYFVWDYCEKRTVRVYASEITSLGDLRPFVLR